jgi:prepilin-type N-terminal cleavage/methylation domain-containing protein
MYSRPSNQSGSVPRSATSTHRRGFSLIELMIAVTLMLFIFAMVIPFLRTQTRQVGVSAGNLDALQNARFSQNAIDRELRVAGAGVVPQQMFIVQAAPMAITFNADLVTPDSSDPTGVYYDPNVDTSTTHALPAAQAVTLPLSALQYPGQDYVSAPGVLGPAQTISYWLAPDSSLGVSHMYKLYRRVNSATATIVSTGINVPAGTAFFQYYKINQATGTLDSIPNASLPLIHTAVQHSAPSDTGASAQTDSIRAVSMTVTGMYNDPAKGPIYRTVSTLTKLLNAGLLAAAACGQPPITVTPVPVATWYGGAATDSVTLTWPESSDQDGGERDVNYYIVYRRPVGAPSWGDPATTFAAGTPTYHWVDPSAPNLHGAYQYNVIAQDCTPANSGDAISNSVTLP